MKVDDCLALDQHSRAEVVVADRESSPDYRNPKSLERMRHDIGLQAVDEDQADCTHRRIGSIRSDRP
jgi:hypothetical protein